MDRMEDSGSSGGGSIPPGATISPLKDKYFTYVIKSLHFQFIYKGHCSNLENRLKEHNSGMTKSIRKFAPFEIIYFEGYQTRNEAVLREKYFKSSAGRRFLKKKGVY